MQEGSPAAAAGSALTGEAERGLAACTLTDADLATAAGCTDTGTGLGAGQAQPRTPGTNRCLAFSVPWSRTVVWSKLLWENQQGRALHFVGPETAPPG